MPKKVLNSATHAYEILKQVGVTEEFNLYLCKSDGESYILKIAATIERNALLDREAFILNQMRNEAARLEEEYATVKSKPEEMLNYQLCFPDLVESFLAPSQGNRRVNILGFPAVDDLGTLVPIRHLTTRDRVRVDRKTSAWMMGKFLKILVFAHSQGIEIRRVTGDNILIERDEHYVAVFDLTAAEIYARGVPDDVAREEISRGAAEVILALGGDPITGKVPKDDEQDPDNQYAKHLYALARGNEDDAKQAHEHFYSLVRLLWPRAYWPFTAYNL